MMLYYRYFHVRRLGYMLGEQHGTNSTNASSDTKNGKPNAADNTAIPGVFNCRFSNPVNSATNARKKKKPTSFVPPPAATAAFWRRPLPAAHNHHGGSSENEGSSVGSRVNIQQKLQEKKQKQLAELRVIEEEIKQGKLAKTAPAAAEEIYSSLQRQPIPRAKTHDPAWPDPAHYQNYPPYPTYTEIKRDYFPADAAQYEDRTFYENPGDLRGDAAPLRSTYLAGACRSPRTAYVADVTAPTYDTSALDKARLANQTASIYSEGHRRSDFGYDESGPGYMKSDYGLGGLAAPAVDMRGVYEACDQYRQTDRFPYAGKKAEHTRKIQRCRTPEILLAPHYLEGCNRQACCHWSGSYANRKKEEGGGGSSGEESAAADTPRPPSDIDSQISLPRSYTLPREFRYWRRRPRARDAHLPSNNSSDGDVDSGDNDSTGSSARGVRPDMLPPHERRRRARRPPPAHPHKPETKL